MGTAPPSSASSATASTGDPAHPAAGGVMPLDLRDRADALRARRTPFVVATVVRAERPTSAKAGDRALILPDGTLEGFVGGTCAESTIRQFGLRLLSGGPEEVPGRRPAGGAGSTLLRIEPQPDLLPADHAHVAGHHHPRSGDASGPNGVAASDSRDRDGVVTVANPCLSGGALEIFLESVIPPPRVHVLGAAPIAQALARLGTALGYDMADTTDPTAPLAPDTAAVIVASHGRDEEAMLAAALHAAVPYVGLVASRRRSAAVLSALDATDDERARIRTPAGLDIGAQSAPEIALSILAEIVATRAGTTSAAPGQAGPSAVPDDAPAHRNHATGSQPVTAIDPVCGMTVEATPGSLRYEHNGATYYFCGAGCRHAFAADPETYL